MWIRKKKRKGKRFYYAVESFRDDAGRSRQRTVAYLGNQASIAARKNQLRKESRKVSLLINEARFEVSEAEMAFRPFKQALRKPKRGEPSFRRNTPKSFRTANTSLWLASQKLSRLEKKRSNIRNAMEKLRKLTR
jgi:hypothetical protein